MVVVQRGDVKFSVDKRLYASIIKYNIENLKKEDSFKIFLVCGLGGSGKSAFANQMCALLDPKFNIDHVGFTTPQFRGILMKKLNSAVTFDEAYRGISGRNTLGKEQKKLLRMFYEIRQFNQCIFLCTGSFFRLDEAYAVELSDGMFLIYKRKRKDGRIERCYKFFNRKKKSKLYYLAKKLGKNYNLVQSTFKGKVTTNTYIIPDAIYRKKKLDSITESDEEDIDQPIEDKYRDRFALLSKKLADDFNFGYTMQESLLKSYNLPLTESVIGKYARKVSKKPEILVSSASK